MNKAISNNFYCNFQHQSDELLLPKVNIVSLNIKNIENIIVNWPINRRNFFSRNLDHFNNKYLILKIKARLDDDLIILKKLEIYKNNL